MIGREVCVGCPDRTESMLGKLRNACASLALGDDFIAEDCKGGPFVKKRVSESCSHEEALIGGHIVAVVNGCAKDEEPIPVIDVHYAGDEIIITQSNQVIEHNRNGKPIS